MRRRILDAAKQLFARESYESVSVRRIAGAIDYSPAAIYRYFGGKREIFSVLREEGFQRFVESQQQRMHDIADPLTRLRAGFKGYLRFAMSEPEYFHLMFCSRCDEVDLEGDLAENSLKSFGLFRQNVEEVLKTGHFGSMELESVVFALWASVHGLAHLIITGRVAVLSEGDLDRLIDSITEFQLRSGGLDDVVQDAQGGSL